MWFNVVEEESNEFELVTIGTGHDWRGILHKEEYIGSLVVAQGMFVWHYFLINKVELSERMKKKYEVRV